MVSLIIFKKKNIYLKFLDKQRHDYHDSLSTLNEIDETRVNSTKTVLDLNENQTKTPKK